MPPARQALPSRGLLWVVNALFAGAFVVGALWLWIGLSALILDRDGAGRGVTGMAVGFVSWAVLALASRLPDRTGDPS
jgi:hypothetical protein